MIRAPRYPRSHPDRGIHAEEAIEASFDATWQIALFSWAGRLMKRRSRC